MLSLSYGVRQLGHFAMVLSFEALSCSCCQQKAHIWYSHWQYRVALSVASSSSRHSGHSSISGVISQERVVSVVRLARLLLVMLLL